MGFVSVSVKVHAKHKYRIQLATLYMPDSLAINIDFVFIILFPLDVLVSLSKKTNVFCNKLRDATFYVPACRLLIGSEMTTNTDKTCHEILDDVVIDEKFPQERHKSNRRSKNKPNVRNKIVFPLNCNFCEEAWELGRPLLGVRGCFGRYSGSLFARSLEVGREDDSLSTFIRYNCYRLAVPCKVIFLNKPKQQRKIV